MGGGRGRGGLGRKGLEPPWQGREVCIVTAARELSGAGNGSRARLSLHACARVWRCALCALPRGVHLRGLVGVGRGDVEGSGFRRRSECVARASRCAPFDLMDVLVGSTGPACASVFGYACRLVCCGECRRHFEAASECSRRRDRLLDPFSATRRNGVRGNGKGGIYICSAYSYLEGGRNVCQIRDLILETLPFPPCVASNFLFSVEPDVWAGHIYETLRVTKNLGRL